MMPVMQRSPPARAGSRIAKRLAALFQRAQPRRDGKRCRRDGGAARETEITEGKIKGNEVSFTVVREFNGNKMTSKYTGKVTADVIKGKMEFERNGETQSRDWEANAKRRRNNRRRKI